MPRNLKGGSGHKKGKNKPTHASRKPEDISKDFTPTAYEVYGLISGELGNRRFTVKCQSLDNPSVLIDMKCMLRKVIRQYISKDTHVLVQIAEYNHTQGTIIDVYSRTEVDSLQSIGRWDFPQNVDIGSSSDAPQQLNTINESSDSDESSSDSDDDGSGDSDNGSSPEDCTNIGSEVAARKPKVATIAETVRAGLLSKTIADEIDIDTI